MEVPQHIYVAGGPNDDGPNPATTAQKKRALASEAGMVVPGRITVGGGDTHHGGRSQPVEVLANNQLLATPLSVDTSAINGIPQCLTANECKSDGEAQYSQHGVGQQHQFQDQSALSSLAVDEDPLRELKNVRREVRRLRQRVSILETEAHDRDGTLGWLKTFNGLALIALVMFILSKKKP